MRRGRQTHARDPCAVTALWCRPSGPRARGCPGWSRRRSQPAGAAPRADAGSLPRRGMAQRLLTRGRRSALGLPLPTTRTGRLRCKRTRQRLYGRCHQMLLLPPLALAPAKESIAELLEDDSVAPSSPSCCFQHRSLFLSCKGRSEREESYLPVKTSCITSAHVPWGIRLDSLEVGLPPKAGRKNNFRSRACQGADRLLYWRRQGRGKREGGREGEPVSRVHVKEGR